MELKNWQTTHFEALNEKQHNIEAQNDKTQNYASYRQKYATLLCHGALLEDLWCMGFFFAISLEVESNLSITIRKGPQNLDITILKGAPL